MIYLIYVVFRVKIILQMMRISIPIIIMIYKIILIFSIKGIGYWINPANDV